LGQQGLDLAPEIVIPLAGIGQEHFSLRWLSCESCVVKRLDLPPALRFHGFSPRRRPYDTAGQHNAHRLFL
jgi:hypothetical protein